MEQLIRKIVKELKTKISDKYKLHEVRIFGSSARGDRRAGSDIDVFVRLPQVNRQIEEPLAETTQIDSAVLHNVPQPTHIYNI